MRLPTTDRLLLGPGPSPISPVVHAALSAAPRSHLDPDLVGLLDDIRQRLSTTFRAAADARVLAVSGTGTSALEAAVANLVEPGRRALVVVNGYFGDRLAQVMARYGADVQRVEGDWGRAADPEVVGRALAAGGFDLVGLVHGETSTGVVNPAREIATLARAHDALTVLDTVTTLGAVPVEMSAWDVDVCYSCSQKGLGAPSGLSPLAFSARALGRRIRSRSFYLDWSLLESFWLERRYHHTISAPLVYALHAALGEVTSEGLEARWQRHERAHRALVDAIGRLDMSLLPPDGERLWSLNAVTVPAGVEEAGVRQRLLREHEIEIGAGLGPLAGRIWRVGLMGFGATTANVERLSAALTAVLT